MRKFSSGVSVPEKVTKQQSGKQFSQWRPTILIFCLLISSDSALSRAELHFCHHWFLSPVQSITRNETLDMKKQCYMTRTWLMSILGGFPPFQNWKDKNKELGIFFFCHSHYFYSRVSDFLLRNSGLSGPKMHSCLHPDSEPSASHQGRRTATNHRQHI